MTLSFRNLEVSPDDPVELWGFEGLLAAVDRGDLRDWRRIVAAVSEDPWGEVVQTLEQVVELAEDSGAAGALQAAVALLRDRRREDERREVAARLGRLVAESGLTRAEFARRLGTSGSRLSTYLTGQVVPSAALMVRAERVASNAVSAPSRSPLD
jgi:DNA-binding transcriptional regulator YiaG